MIITRFTCEILGAIPVGELQVSARLARPGRSVEFLEAVAPRGGREVARARAWRVLRTPETRSRRAAARRRCPRPGPGRRRTAGSTGTCRPSSGGRCAACSASPGRPRCGAGCATRCCRTRNRVPWSGCSPSPTAATAPPASWTCGRWHFINPELTVHLHREAAGEWICLDAQTTISAGGTGLATSVLSDLDGPVGVGAQSLLIARASRGLAQRGPQAADRTRPDPERGRRAARALIRSAAAGPPRSRPGARPAGPPRAPTRPTPLRWHHPLTLRDSR